MGQEAICMMRNGKQRSQGKALLETAEVIFRPADGGARLKIPFSSIQSAKVFDGELRLDTANGLVALELGSAAGKWREKILHPKARVEKLGVKSGMSISLLGQFDAEFMKELGSAKVEIKQEKLKEGSALIFLGAQSLKQLASVLGKVSNAMKGAIALWVVYPKGNKEISQQDVLNAGRKVGLKDVKVVGFSTTHTALKFVVPVAKR
jgi:hypothetical protein